MKRYLLFYGLKMSPDGGMHDFIKDNDSLQVLVDTLMNGVYNLPSTDQLWSNTIFSHIYDIHTKQIVWENGKLLHNETVNIHKGEL